jgi:hypothetical protein
MNDKWPYEIHKKDPVGDALGWLALAFLAGVMLYLIFWGW